MSVTQSVERKIEAVLPPRGQLVRVAFVPLSLVFSGVAIMLAALLAWSIWSLFPYAQPSSLGLHMRLGVGAALLAGLFTTLRGEHSLTYYAAGENTPTRTMRVWNLVVIVVLVLAFLTRNADDLSRGTFVLFYAIGFLAFWGSRAVSSWAVKLANRLRILVAKRILVVGTVDGIASFLRRHQPWNLGFEVVGTVEVTAPLPGQPSKPSAEFLQAVELARNLSIDDVYIAVPWSQTDTIDLCLDTFLTTPIAIHLAPEQVLDRFDQVAISRVGAMASIVLTRPMTTAALLVKRSVDLVLATVGLVALMPLFAVVAVMIKRDTSGPVFFYQTRYGFNQRRFRIVKFRTMTTFSDDADVAQAVQQDARITRVGRILRRTNLDELPQLLNVLAGQMSLVGPRPHAVPHNRDYERRIALYARRHNVRPGITGWAQVNGLRGETETDDKMHQRVQFDLFYIDNWSMLLDIRILLLTVFSAKAYRNAY